MADRNLGAVGGSDTGNTNTTPQYPGSVGEASNLIINGSNHGKVTSFSRANGSFTVVVSPDANYGVDKITITCAANAKTYDLVKDSSDTEYILSGSNYHDFVNGLTPEQMNTVEFTVVALFKDIRPAYTITSTSSGGVGGSNPVVTNASDANKTASTAKAGDRLLIKVNPNANNNTLQALTYIIKDSSNNQTVKTEAITTKENPTGNVFVFVMPNLTEGQTLTINAEYRMLNPGEKQLINETPTTNSAGSSVGVGAAFALHYGSMTSESGIGENRKVETGTLDISAEGTNNTTTISVAGTDPISGTDNTGLGSSSSTNSSTDVAEQAKDIAVDASAALNLSYNNVIAYINSSSSVTTRRNDLNVTPFDEEQFKESFQPDENSQQSAEDQLAQALEAEREAHKDMVSLRLQAIQKGNTLSKASGFAVGNKAAVGAAVAVNIVDSNV